MNRDAMARLFDLAKQSGVVDELPDLDDTDDGIPSACPRPS